MVFNKHVLILVACHFFAIVCATIGVVGIYASHAVLLSCLFLCLSILFIIKSLRIYRQQQQQFNEIINALKYKDSSFRLSADHALAPAQQQLCNDLIKRVQADKVAQAEQVAVFETMLRHIDAGVILVKNNLDVEICNNTAKRLLNLRQVMTLQQLLDAAPMLEKVKQGELVEKELLFRYFSFNYNNNGYQLWLFTPISEQIESTQIASWQKLIKVLIHEIGNSVAPIYSLSNTLVKVTESQLKPQLNTDPCLFDDFIESLNAISIRSESLLGFIEHYRTLTHVPKLELQPLLVTDLFENLKAIEKSEFAQKNVSLQFNVENPMLTIEGDKKLIEQVLINVIKNALDALILSQIDNKMVEVNARINRYGKCEIAIIDNGDGIDESALDKIFVPFFTTKRDGSGIGLALCQQIIHRHKGRIKVDSEKGKGCKVTLLLSK